MVNWNSFEIHNDNFYTVSQKFTHSNILHLHLNTMLIKIEKKIYTIKVL